jgi:cellulose synthase/poly-beta-1,6-N-acetylglucosamine synthase-like glycosyltransferase
MIEISALLPTRNRAHLLPRVLDALREQTLAPSRFEIIAVYDDPADGTSTVLRRYAENMPLRIFQQRHSGLAEAKNLGLFASRSPIVVFLDDDDVAAPDLLAVHLATHTAHPDTGIAVLGHTHLALDTLRSPVMRHVTDVGCQLFSYGGMRSGQILGYAEFWGGRSSCKRELLLRNGVFNPAFRFGYEDIECAWRLAPHGLRVIYEPAASSTMIRTISFDDFCTRSYRQGRSQFHFASLHPHPEVRKYCEIDVSLAEWRAHWRDYAAILRRTRELDRLANIRIEAGFTIPVAFQNRLDAAYHQAFFLTRAKGVADALSLAPARASGQSRGKPRYGLPGDLSDLLGRIEVAAGSKSFATAPPS